MRDWRDSCALTLSDHDAPSCHQAGLPAGAAGRWCRLAVGVSLGLREDGERAWWAKVEVEDCARGQVVRDAFLGPCRRHGRQMWRETLLHLPGEARSLTLRLFGEPGSAPLAALRVLARGAATVALVGRGWRLLPRVLAGDPAGLPGRARTTLGQAPARAGEAPDYTTWTRLYDHWGERERTALADGVPDPPGLAVAVVGPEGEAQDATFASLAAQWRGPSRAHRVATPGEWVATGEPWLLVLQAGETLAPHALACLALAMRREPEARGFYADADRLLPTGRASPLFKPLADPWLLRSGLLTKGACLFQGASVAAAPLQGAADADAWRQAIALSLPDGTFRPVPLVLTHVPDLSGGIPHRATTPGNNLPSVSIVIPSAGRSRHMLRCLRRLLARTDYPGDLEVLLAISRVDGEDAAQATALARASRLPNTRVLDLGMTAFNYAQANNLAVRQARGDLVLLLNDDVVPIRADWLRRMVALTVTSDGPAADIVGARLLYGNGSVQHGGVIMGLANLCEHAFRLSARDDAGAHGIAMLDREVSAVTGACLLVRRSIYETSGGMDESFRIALNDVDFCLRVGRAGARIVLAAGVTLYHYESLSFGRHYAGARAARESVEVRRLRHHWHDVIEADPFYSLSASLQPGREFQPGFPPRITPQSWLSGQPLRNMPDS